MFYPALTAAIYANLSILFMSQMAALKFLPLNEKNNIRPF
jgi:hypothetical protein